MLFDAKVCDSDNPNHQEPNAGRDKIPGQATVEGNQARKHYTLSESDYCYDNKYGREHFFERSDRLLARVRPCRPDDLCHARLYR
jgi:hypothetical protein